MTSATERCPDMCPSNTNYFSFGRRWQVIGYISVVLLIIYIMVGGGGVTEFHIPESEAAMYRKRTSAMRMGRV